MPPSPPSLPPSAPPSPPFDCQEANVVFDSFNALLNKDFVVTEDANGNPKLVPQADRRATFVKVMVPRGEEESLMDLSLIHI